MPSLFVQRTYCRFVTLPERESGSPKMAPRRFFSIFIRMSVNVVNSERDDLDHNPSDKTMQKVTSQLLLLRIAEAEFFE